MKYSLDSLRQGRSFCTRAGVKHRRGRSRAHISYRRFLEVVRTSQRSSHARAAAARSQLPDGGQEVVCARVLRVSTPSSRREPAVGGGKAEYKDLPCQPASQALLLDCLHSSSALMLKIIFRPTDTIFFHIVSSFIYMIKYYIYKCDLRFLDYQN